MPLAFLAALAGSLVLHAVALFLPEVDLSTTPELPALRAELQPPPPPASDGLKQASSPAAGKRHPDRRRGKPARRTPEAVFLPESTVSVSEPESQLRAEPPVQEAPERDAEKEAEAGQEPETLAATPQESRLPGQGYIRFDVFKGSGGLLVGRAEHRWEFSDGNYRLQALTETVGLAALLKSVNIELESRGQLTAAGLQPERFSTRRNGGGTRENADFDWQEHQLILERDGSRHAMSEGAQDLLSFHYQFGYLAGVEQGADMGVASGKKYELYHFRAVGEEDVETPAGHFRTLHLKVRTDSTTELWLALDHRLLPVKIRYTDKKGESFEQLATELGI